MRRLLVTLSLLCGLLTPISAEQFYLSSLNGVSFQSMQQFGGGFVVGQDSLSTSVHLVRTDCCGAYGFGNDSKWHPLITNNSMAGAACDVALTPGSCSTVFPTSGISQVIQAASGVNELCASPAPGGQRTAFMFYKTNLFITTNLDPNNLDAVTWINTNQLAGGGFPTNTDSSNNANRINGRFMACDPNNVNHLIVGLFTAVGTPLAGLYESIDKGNSFQPISSSDIPLSTGLSNYEIAFDPASGVNGSGNTNVIYIYTNGAPAGIYKTTVGGGLGNWTKVVGSPTSLTQHMIVANGDVWLINGANAIAGNLIRCFAPCNTSGATITTMIPTSLTAIHAIAINPLNSNQVAAVSVTGHLLTASDGGIAPSSFTGVLNYTVAGGDAPWQATITTNISGASAGDIAFDNATNGLIWFDGGQAIFTTTFTNTTPYVWTTHVANVMQIIGVQVVSPAAGVVVAGGEDVGSCTFFNPLPPASPVTACNPLNQGRSLEFAAGLAVSATDPTFMCGKIGPNSGTGNDYSGCSTDYFVNASNFRPFNRWSAQSLATALTNNGSGNIRVTLSGGYSTTGLNTWSAGPPQTGDIVCTYPTNTVIGGNVLTINGTADCFEASVISSTQFDLIGAAFTTPVTTTGGSYVYYVPTAPIYNNEGALNVIGITNDAGHIRVNFLYGPLSPLNSGGYACVSGVLVATEANGCFIVSNLVETVGNAGFTEKDTVFNNSYGGAGVINAQGPTGGSIGMASNTNFAIVPGNNAPPQCTTNGGKTWNPLTYVASPAPVPVTVTTVIDDGSHPAGYPAGYSAISVNDTTVLRGANGTSLFIPMDDGRMFFSTLATVSPATGNGVITFHAATSTVTGTISNGSGGAGNQLVVSSGTGMAIGQGVVGAGVPQGTLITAGSGTSWTVNNSLNVGSENMTFNQVIPPGRSIPIGVSAYDQSGYDNSYFLNQHIVVADTVQANTFFAVSFQGGLMRWTNCNPVIVANATVQPNGWQNGGGFNETLKAVPHQSGHLVYTVGPTLSALSAFPIYQFCDGNNSTAGGMVNPLGLPGTFAAQVVGVGAPKPGSRGYASILYPGWYDPKWTPAQGNSKWGIWESTDNPNNGNSGPSVGQCKSVGGSFTGVISGATLTASSVTGTIAIGDGLKALNNDLATLTIKGFSRNPEIVTQLSGIPGGAGTYQLSVASPVASESMTAGGTFHQIGDWPSVTPGGPKITSNYNDISGDAILYGPLYINTNSGGAYVGSVNFLLKRDLDPAANDNSPVFLNIAA